MTKDKRLTIELSPAQAVAAYVACHNYTPPRGTDWAHRSQRLAATALGLVVRKAGMAGRIKRRK